MFRGTARTFATDPLARDDRPSRDRTKASTRDVPDEHAQLLLSAVPAFGRRSPTRNARSRSIARWGDADNIKWADIHADIIRKFGRFPHRNAMLGRQTTPEEQAFLDGGGFKG